MKASELIQELQAAMATFGDVLITVNGYEGGMQTPTAVETLHGIRHLPDDRPHTLFGTHEEIGPDRDLPDDPRLEPVILITRYPKE